MILRLSTENQSSKTRRRFTVQQKQEAIEVCLREGLSCNAVAQRLGLSTNSLAKWVQQARMVRRDLALLIRNSSPAGREP
jgi:transposase-like protein